jgi:cytochrome c-type biogenesis protein CcmE
MTHRQKRVVLLGIALLLLGLATVLVVRTFQENLVFFYTPTEVRAGRAPQDRPFRIGGLVETGSIYRNADGVEVFFVITDTAVQIPVTYQGSLPDLFQEGKGAVVQGHLDSAGRFIATQVLAKHDENYMPPEAQSALDKAHFAPPVSINPETRP